MVPRLLSVVFIAFGLLIPAVGSAQSCPNYEYKDNTPFGATLDEAAVDFASRSCTFTSGKRNRAKIPAIAQTWKDSFLFQDWNLPDFGMWEEPLTEAKVSCSCWDTQVSMRLLFRTDKKGETRLLAVEKQFDELVPVHGFLADFQLRIDDKADYAGSVYLTSDQGRDDARGMLRWVDERQDLLVDIRDDGGSLDVRSLYVDGAQLSEYLFPVWQRRFQPPEPEDETARKMADEL